VPSLSDVTLFDIAEIGVPPYSARGITENFGIEGGQLLRDINGTLQDLGATQFRKLTLTVTCTDMDSPALDGVWRGRTLTIDCQTEFSYKTGGSPERTVVPGSSRTGMLASADGGGADGFTYYRPRLTMKVADWQTSTGDGWGNVGVNWQMQLREV